MARIRTRLIEYARQDNFGVREWLRPSTTKGADALLFVTLGNRHFYELEHADLLAYDDEAIERAVDAWVADVWNEICNVPRAGRAVTQGRRPWQPARRASSSKAIKLLRDPSKKKAR
jgi:hypothetical protein